MKTNKKQNIQHVFFSRFKIFSIFFSCSPVYLLFACILNDEEESVLLMVFFIICFLFADICVWVCVVCSWKRQTNIYASRIFLILNASSWIFENILLTYWHTFYHLKTADNEKNLTKSHIYCFSSLSYFPVSTLQFTLLYTRRVVCIILRFFFLKKTKKKLCACEVVVFNQTFASSCDFFWIL